MERGNKKKDAGTQASGDSDDAQSEPVEQLQRRSIHDYRSDQQAGGDEGIHDYSRDLQAGGDEGSDGEDHDRGDTATGGAQSQPVEELQKDLDKLTIGAPPEVCPIDAIPDLPWVFWDLETTGLARTSHITQIAAYRSADDHFSCYILPKVPVEHGASVATGLSLDDGKLHLHGEPVDALPIQEAMKQFIDFLGGRVILIGHNIKNFDSKVFLNACSNCGMLDAVKNAVFGFFDTLVCLRKKHPMLVSYKQEALYKHFISGEYNAHDALADVTSLSEIMLKACPEFKTEKSYLFTSEYILSDMAYKAKVKEAVNNWEPMVKSKHMSQYMAEKAAGRGLKLSDLQSCYDTSGAEGLEEFLIDKLTKDKKVIAKITKYFTK